MKIIDLLNKIAKGEEVPLKIKYKNYIYEYQYRRDTESSFNYMCNENGEYLSRRYFIDNILNDEVEIIEEEKEIKKFHYNNAIWEEQARDLDYMFKDKIDELIDYYDKLQQNINKIMEIIELNQYSYGYQIKEEILKDSDVDV